MIRSDERAPTASGRRRSVGFEEQYMRMVPQFDVATGAYDGLRENIFVACGRLAGPRAFEYEMYRVG